MMHLPSDTAFYFILPDVPASSWVNIVWSDVRPLGKVFLATTTLKSNWLRKLKKIHFSNKANKKFWLPMKHLWNGVFPIKADMLDTKKRNYIIFHSGVKFSPSYLGWLKRHCNACIVLYLPDTLFALNIANNSAEWTRYKEYYGIDLVFSFDPEDCKRYGFMFFDIYSCFPVDMFPNIKEARTDIFYVGSCRTEERLKLVQKIYEKMHGQTTCSFRITGVPEKDIQQHDEIIYNIPISYRDVIGEIMKSRCILEIINPGQYGNTLRYKEAICYGKKLLTNNPDVLTSRYYNPRWIQYFKDAEDIDVGWIVDGDEPMYHYGGEFSPKHLLNMIVESNTNLLN